MSILIENVTKHFGQNIVLDDINLEIKTGSLVALLGGSGSGKSTLLRVVAGFEEPNTGRVWLNGKDSSSLSIQEKEIGFVFQAYALFQHLTVYENIAFGLSCNSSSFEFEFTPSSLINWFSKSFVGPILTNGMEQSSYKYNTPFKSNDLRKKKFLASNSVLIDQTKRLTNRNQFKEGLVMSWDSNTHIDKPQHLSQQENYSFSKEKIQNQKLFNQEIKLLPGHGLVRAQEEVMVGSEGPTSLNLSPLDLTTRRDSLNQQNYIENNHQNNTTNFLSLKKTKSEKTELSSNTKSCGDKLHLSSLSSSSGALRSVEELLRLVGLEDLAHRYPNQLSGGQCQRVALARALAVQPKVLLLDEPFGALDTKVRKNLRRWLRQLHERVGVTTLFVTHDHQEAMEVANEIVVLDKGRVKHSLNSPQKMFSRLVGPSDPTLSQKT